ncbi:hypothetical protein [Peribacillus simplex]|uniref:hypothetical protein n=1 Tax=Peribacillus simplex TaxID=1478 RepID=UPI003D2BE646
MNDTQIVRQQSDRTTLIITHRLATIRNADKIAVDTEEGIVEEGGHDDLLKQGRHFCQPTTITIPKMIKSYMSLRGYIAFLMEWSSIHNNFDKTQFQIYISKGIQKITAPF